MSELANEKSYVEVGSLDEIMNHRILGIVIIVLLSVFGLSLYSLGLIGRNPESLTSQSSTSMSSASETIIATSISVATTTSSPSSLILGRNLKLDNYSDASGYTDGVEPYVAVGKDGTIHVVWLGLKFFLSTTYYEQGTTSFDYQIWYSESRDGGASFSSPVAVSRTSQNTDPSIALAPNGDVLVGYHHRNRSILFSRKAVNSTGFQEVLVYDGKGNHVDRPWIAVTPNTGAIYMTWYENGNAYWTVSKDKGVSFSKPAVLISKTPQGDPFSGFPTGIAVSSMDTVFISLHSQLYRRGSVLLYEAYIAAKGASENFFQVTQLAERPLPYRLDAFDRNMLHPGPTVAAEDSTVLFAYVSCNGTCLYVARSVDDGRTWTSNELVWRSTGLVEMPWMTVKNNTLVVAWRDTAGGYWNTYVALYRPGTALTPVKASDHNGYTADVLNWHGDFLGVAFLGNDRVVVVWSDGRDYGTAINYGYGHIYSSVMPVI